MKQHWRLAPEVTFLNHGSFGACPAAVLEFQSRIRNQLEARPVRFMLEERPALLDAARTEVARFVGANPLDVVFTHNATAGVNAVLRSLRFRQGDELLTTDHTYPACRNVLDFVAAQTGATVRVAPVPFPIQSEDQVVRSLLEHTGARTRLVLVDHVTSPTAIRFPVARIAGECRKRSILTLVDGAHAPGMIDLNIDAISADFYVANFHKWMCAPKGAGMLWVRRELQDEIYPGVISHGYTAEKERQFQALFDWVGTEDSSAWLSVPFALRHMAALGTSWQEIRRRNHELAVRAREILCDALALAPPAPDSMLGTMAAVALPGDVAGTLNAEALHRALAEQYQFEVLISAWPDRKSRLLRVSAQLYNETSDYTRLTEVLQRLRS